VAGALLITPGVLTDVLGFMGLLPPTRYLIRKVVMKRIRKKVEEGAIQMQFGLFGGAAPGSPSTSEGWNAAPSPGDGAANGTSEWQGTQKDRPDHHRDDPDSSSPPSAANGDRG
jgi:UPF0716 protein FxsA